jgi:hypothetical protein
MKSRKSMILEASETERDIGVIYIIFEKYYLIENFFDSETNSRNEKIH